MRALKGTENLGAFCKSEDKLAMMRYLGCDEKYNQGRCSDFEFLAEWERILPLCAGSESARLYEKQLSLFGISTQKNERERYSPIELWRCWNEKITEEKELYFMIEYQKMIEKPGIDIFEYVTNISIGKEEKEFPSESFWEEAAASFCERPHVFFDLSSLCYVRPDRYHAMLAWQKMNCGEKLNSEEHFVLCLQCLIELLLRCKQQKKFCVVHLFSEDTSLCVKTVDYLKENRLMEGEIRFSLFLTEPASSWLPICHRSDSALRVLPELMLRPSELGTLLTLALREISSVYPIGGLRFGRTLTDSESLALVARKEVYETIDAFLASEKICDEKRQEILLNIFNY